MEVRLMIQGEAWGLPAITPQELVPQALLRMAGVRYDLRRGVWPESSPSGQLPIAQTAPDVTPVGEPWVVGALLELETVAGLDVQRTPRDKLDTQAYADTLWRLDQALLYALWCDAENYTYVTYPVYSRMFPYPLSASHLWWRQLNIVTGLRANNLDRECEVYRMADRCYRVLDSLLGSGKYFGGDKPCSLDAMVFGTIAVHLHAHLPNHQLRSLLLKYPHLVTHCQSILTSFFPESIESHPELLDTTEIEDADASDTALQFLPDSWHVRPQNRKSAFLGGRRGIPRPSIRNIAITAAVSSLVLISILKSSN